MKAKFDRATFSIDLCLSTPAPDEVSQRPIKTLENKVDANVQVLRLPLIVSLITVTRLSRSRSLDMVAIDKFAYHWPVR